MVTILSKLKSFTSVVQVYQPFTIYQHTHLLTVTPVLSLFFLLRRATVLAACGRLEACGPIQNHWDRRHLACSPVVIKRHIIKRSMVTILSKLKSFTSVVQVYNKRIS
jgi:hypothetical protein